MTDRLTATFSAAVTWRLAVRLTVSDGVTVSAAVRNAARRRAAVNDSDGVSDAVRVAARVRFAVRDGVTVRDAVAVCGVPPLDAEISRPIVPHECEPDQDDDPVR